MATKNYAPKLPLQLDNNGEFVNISDVLLNIKQKLRMIILTNPGEKLMDPQFGVGIRRYLFEPTNGLVQYNIVNGSLDTISTQDFKSAIESSIKKQVAQYSDDININNVEVTVEEQQLYLFLEYSYRGLYTDNLELIVSA